MQALLIQAAAMTGLAEKNLMMNTMITNVPGAPLPALYVRRPAHRFLRHRTLAPGMGLFHTVNSMVMKNKGAITLAFICCREVMPDPEFYSQCIEESPNYSRYQHSARKPPAKEQSGRLLGNVLLRFAGVFSTRGDDCNSSVEVGAGLPIR